MQKTQSTIDAYILNYPKPVQAILRKIRLTIRKVAPNATEAMSYGIPTFKLHGNLVHFAAYKKHIGFYPGSAAIRTFLKEIEKKYTWSKGTIQFPLDKPIPYGLVQKITRFRVKVNTEK